MKKSNKNKSKTRKLLIFILIVTGLGFLFNSFYIQGKAIVAQYLIANAWEKTVETKVYNKPWPWADISPVLKMYVPKLDEKLYILDGDSGAALAFAPGHAKLSFLPGQNGTVMLSAHRDTHFSFLQKMNIEDEISLYDKNNTRHRYRITRTKIIDSNKDKVGIYLGKEELVLVTCWPFDAIRAGGSERYVVYAQRV